MKGLKSLRFSRHFLVTNFDRLYKGSPRNEILNSLWYLKEILFVFSRFDWLPGWLCEAVGVGPYTVYLYAATGGQLP